MRLLVAWIASAFAGTAAYPIGLCVAVWLLEKWIPGPDTLVGRSVLGLGLTKCLDCIRKTSEQHRIERARVAMAAEQTTLLGGLVPPSKLDLANVRPLGKRLPPELFAAAKRFVFDFRDGQTEAVANKIEPELYGLLEWLAQQSIVDADRRRAPEEVGRAILGYRDNNTSRGVAYGALWAALVRLAAVYSSCDSKTISLDQHSK